MYLYQSREGDLLVFSNKSGRLYGFDQLGATIFFSLKDNKFSKEDLIRAAENNKVVHSLICTIDNLLKGIEEPEGLKTTPEYNFPSILTKTTSSSPLYYQFDRFVFIIDTDNKSILEKIMPSLSHLLCDCDNIENVTVNIGFISDSSGWSICLNGEALHRGLMAEEILPRLLDSIRIAYYRSNDYLVSLHAGALYFNKKPLILPAVSGSGKSTLTTYLMDQGFEFLTDEVATIGKNGRIRPIPLSIILKEGSWKTLSSCGIVLDNLLIHKRFDGQKLRMLPPSNIAVDNLDTKGAYLVFPHYATGEATKVEPLSTLQALNIIVESGYEVEDSYDEKTIAQWIALVETFKKYTITYSDLEDARQHIEQLMSMDE